MNPGMPVAVISANLQQEVVSSAAGAGASFLPKPLTQDALEGFLKSAVERLKAAGK
jgi:DNA-binding NtrC family response regulator